MNIGSWAAWRGVTQSRVWFPVPMVIFCCAVIFALHRQAMLLSVEEDEARLLGVPVGRMRFLLLTLATLVVAAVVSVTGLISFVGLLAPPLCAAAGGAQPPLHQPAQRAGGQHTAAGGGYHCQNGGGNRTAGQYLHLAAGCSVFALPYYKAREGDAVMFTVENLAVRLGDKNILQNVHFTIDTPRPAGGNIGGERQRKNHPAARSGRAFAPYGVLPDGWCAAGKPFYQVSGTNGQLHPAAKRNFGVHVSTGSCADGLQPPALACCKAPPLPCVRQRKKPCAR